LPAFQPPAIKPATAEFQSSSPVEAKGLIPQIFAPPPLKKDFNTLFCVYRI
jgi:hypothetical protein